MRPSRLLSVLLLMLIAAGCTHQPRPVAIEAGEVVPVVYGPGATERPAAPAYRLDSGDRLRVVVFGQEGLTNTYSVDANGAITMPLIGAIQARGLSTAALSQAIAGRLRQGFVREPHVAVEIESYRPFFILGEVTNPGQYAYVANMTVETAVAIAGGFTPRAFKREATLTRGVDGALVQGKVPLIFPVEPGDTINIAERWF